jgi:hypothetical protein
MTADNLFITHFPMSAKSLSRSASADTFCIEIELDAFKISHEAPLPAKLASISADCVGPFKGEAKICGVVELWGHATNTRSSSYS